MDRDARSRSPHGGVWPVLGQAVAMPVAPQSQAPQPVAPQLVSQIFSPLPLSNPVGPLPPPPPPPPPPPGTIGAPEMCVNMQIRVQFLGMLLGFKGRTVNKIKEISGVTRLFIHDIENARSNPSLTLELAGSPEQVETCRRIIGNVCNGDQAELGHVTTYIKIEPTVVGKIMGFKGQTVKQLTEVTECYIEIQQDRAKGNEDSPQLFVAGTPAHVEKAVDIIYRFIAASGSKLDSVMNSTADDPSMINAAAGVLGDADGPKEERVIHVPTHRKGHLLGLRGKTIELIRKTSGVIKCSLQSDRSMEKAETPVQIFGTKDKVDACVQLISQVMAGDHSGIGHATQSLDIPADKVERLRGENWMVINTIKDICDAYLDLMQGPQPGCPAAAGDCTQLFIAGAPDSVQQARQVVSAFLHIVDMVPGDAEVSEDTLQQALAMA